MSRIMRLAGWLLLLLLVLFIALLVLLRFQPDAAVLAANKLLNDTEIATEGLELRYFPPSLAVVSADIELPDQTIAISDVSAAFDASAWRTNSPFWAVTADTVTINVTTPKTAPEPAGPVNLAIPDLAPFLSFTKLGVNQLEMTGASPLTASLSANRQNSDTLVEASVTQAGQHYKLTGTIGSSDSGPMTFDFNIDGAPLAGNTAGNAAGNAARSTAAGTGSKLKAQLAGALSHSGGTTLAITEGSAALTQSVAGGEEVQQLSQLKGTILIPGSGDKIELKEVSARVSSPAAGLENLPLTLSGLITFAPTALNIEALGSLDKSRFDTRLEIANSTGALSGQISLESDGLPEGIAHEPYTHEQLFPALLSTSFSLVENTLSLQDLKLETPNNALAGTANVSTSEPWKLVADLHAPRLFYPLISDPAESNSPAATTAESESEPEVEANPDADKSRVFDDVPIDWTWLKTAEIDVKLAADQLALQEASFTNLKIELQNENGQLSLNPLSASLGDGGFTGSAKLNLQAAGQTSEQAAEENPVNNAAPVALTALFKMSGVSLETFGLVPTEELSGGRVEADISLSTNGSTSAQLAAGLNGNILVMVEEATLMNDFIELVGSDLVMETLNKLNPFAKTDPTTELACALVRFTAEDGKLTTKNQLVMETSKMEIIGTGTINLNDEKLSIGITPNAKSGAGVNIGSVVKFMKLGGTLAAPKPAVSAGGLLKSGLAIGAAISTGGASVVAEGLAKRSLNADSACVAARNTANQETDNDARI